MTIRRLDLTRAQILAHRRSVGGLNERLPPGPRSLRRAAWAGLQDSMPRAALLSIHARVAGTRPSSWEDRSLVQLWGPRWSVYVVAARDLAVFSLGRLPSSDEGRALAHELALRLGAFLGGRARTTNYGTTARSSRTGTGARKGAVTTYGEAGRALGMHPNRLRYAAVTGRILIRWDGARLPTIWTMPPPRADPSAARLELARRYLHIFGPSTAAAFARWAGIAAALGRDAFDALGKELTPVRTPIGDAWILAGDEATFRAPALPATGARLLPGGDAYFLLHGADRELLVPESDRRRALWTPRVWPGGVLLRGELVGTWRRADTDVTVQPWRRLSRTEREVVEAEAESLPVPGVRARNPVHWID